MNGNQKYLEQLKVVLSILRLIEHRSNVAMEKYIILFPQIWIWEKLLSETFLRLWTPITD